MQVSFLLGNGGIYAVAALIYNMIGNKEVGNPIEYILVVAAKRFWSSQ